MEEVDLTRLQRIAVIGTSCSGKTTLARTLCEFTGAQHIELDALHWGPNWQGLPAEKFRPVVEEAVEAEHWCTDGNYSVVRDLVWGRATTIIWLNYSFPVVGKRALRRTLGRVFRREELWAGNRESLKLAFFSQDSILWWVIKTHALNHRKFSELIVSPENQHLQVLVMNSPRDTQKFVDIVRHKCSS
jgi:adenylate kinase family enzyme